MQAVGSIYSCTATNRRNRLAMCVAALLGLAAPSAFAGNIVVTNCKDAGTGSLRSAVAAAASGDTVDMTLLTPSSPGCSESTITLKTGDIAVKQNNLVIKGPGMTALRVTGKYKTSREPHRIFTHTGTGTLNLQYFSISDGYETDYGLARGGCIYSKGTVNLFRVGVYGCEAYSSASYASGGAVFSVKGTTIKYSVISENSALAKDFSYYNIVAGGGGICSFGDVSAKFSTISGNTIGSKSSLIAGGPGGGIASDHDLYLLNTTVSGNSAAGIGGGIVFFGHSGVIVNSTIVGNSAPNGKTGGIYGDATSIDIYNSTIAFNHALVAAPYYSPGLSISAIAVRLQSNLIANNTYGASNTNYDVSITASSTVAGSHNLVRTPSANLPSDTITGECPILGQLRFNGGPTQTMALQSDSPGVDQGNNVFDNGTTTGVTQDQRGEVLDPTPYPYPRVSGSAADIGAYEIQQSDVIFTSNLEGCT
jgi:hypothetical protein